MFLQNAWRRTAKPGQKNWIENRDDKLARGKWLVALWNSKTGKNLKEMLPDGCIIRVENASPQVGNVSWSFYPIDLEWVKAKLQEHKPDIVLLLGLEAQKAEEVIKGVPIVKGHHPAWRALSRREVQRIRRELEAALKIAVVTLSSLKSTRLPSRLTIFSIMQIPPHLPKVFISFSKDFTSEKFR